MDAKKQIAELQSIWDLTETPPEVLQLKADRQQIENAPPTVVQEPQPADVFLVRLREAGGARRYLGLGMHHPADREVRLARFESEALAVAAIQWLFSNNPGAFDLGEIVINKTLVRVLTP